ncbi:hypothetical protein [Rosettibacter firmus]|uniref:hypothetical protein n=1 Tax=Rosettibacter firmus TaxID=3111522 RepID=UPI00336BAF4F
MSRKYLYFFIFFGLYTLVYGQFEVEYSKIEGSLNAKDNYRQNFGRYDGYELELYQGEAINVIVYSDVFSPKIFFVNPKGSVFKEGFSGKTNVATITTSIPESGEWILYVVGDSAATGKYSLQLSIASANSVSLPPDADFCTKLKFILAHANAYFFLLEAPVNSKSEFIKLDGSSDTFIDENDGSYVSKFYEGNSIKDAEKIFKDIIAKVRNCLDGNWKLQSKDWQSVDDYKIKGIMLSESENNIERYIQISLIDLKKSKQKFMGDYIVQMEINRKPD